MIEEQSINSTTDINREILNCIKDIGAKKSVSDFFREALQLVIDQTVDVINFDDVIKQCLIMLKVDHLTTYIRAHESIIEIVDMCPYLDNKNARAVLFKQYNDKYEGVAQIDVNAGREDLRIILISEVMKEIINNHVNYDSFPEADYDKIIERNNLTKKV